LDLPPQFGGVGLQSLIRAANEKLLGSWASVSVDLISFFRSKDLTVYDNLANALDAMANEDGDQISPAIPAIASLQTVSTRAHIFFSDITQTEMDFATATILQERLVEMPGRFASETTEKPEPMVLPVFKTPADYATAPCKHECRVLK